MTILPGDFSVITGLTFGGTTVGWSPAGYVPPYGDLLGIVPSFSGDSLRVACLVEAYRPNGTEFESFPDDAAWVE